MEALQAPGGDQGGTGSGDRKEGQGGPPCSGRGAEHSLPVWELRHSPDM